MIEFFYFALIIINILIPLVGKKSKIIIVISLLFILLFVMNKKYLGGFIAYDLNNYSLRYSRDYFLFNASEVLFSLLMMAFKTAGCSFEEFYMFIVAFSLFLVFIGVLRLNGNFHVFVFTFLIYFVLLPIDQLRNFLAFSLFLQGIPFLFRQKKHDWIWFVVFVGLASLCHSSFIIYFLLLFVFSEYSKKMIAFFAIVSILLIIIFLLGGSRTMFGGLLNSVISFLGFEERYSDYTTTATRFSGLVPIAAILLLLITFNFVFFNTTKKNTKQSSIIFRIIIITFCFTPLVFLNSTMYRFVRDISLVLIIVLSGYFINKSFLMQPKNRIGSIITVASISILWFVFDIVIKGYYLDYMKYFFEF